MFRGGEENKCGTVRTRRGLTGLYHSTSTPGSQYVYLLIYPTSVYTQIGCCSHGRRGHLPLSPGPC